MGKIEGKRPHTRSRHRWNTDMDLKTNRLRRHAVNQAQNRDKWWALLNTVMIPELQQEAEDSLTS
jgi:hypothetical protein